MKSYLPRSLPFSPLPSMQPRQGIVELFSTFVRFDSDRFAGWIPDPKLRRHIHNCSKSRPEVAEMVWVLYWQQLWREEEQRKAGDGGQWTVDSEPVDSGKTRSQESGFPERHSASAQSGRQPPGVRSQQETTSYQPQITRHSNNPENRTEDKGQSKIFQLGLTNVQNPKSVRPFGLSSGRKLSAHVEAKIQNPSNLALGHLTAYLQEPCYWVSRKMALNTTGQSAADLFQTAIARTHSVLKGFNPQLSTNFKGYAEFVFGNVIKDTLRQRQEADICTDWALLHKTSQRRLVQALEQSGLDARTIASYVLAWSCFKELDTASDLHQTRKLTRPDTATWSEIARLYNSQKLSQPVALNSDATPERLEQWLLACARAIRAYLYPKSVSVDIPKGSDDHLTMLETLPSGDSDSLLTQLITQEEIRDREQQQQQLSAVLIGAIATLAPQAQQILPAYYAENLTQTQIAQQLNLKQWTVCRRLTSIRQTLLKQLAKWGQETLHISLNSDVLSSMSTLLDEWLRAYYHPANTDS